MKSRVRSRPARSLAVGIDGPSGLRRRRVRCDQLAQAVFLIRLGQADLCGQRPHIGAEALGRTDQCRPLRFAPNLGFDVLESASSHQFFVN